MAETTDTAVLDSTKAPDRAGKVITGDDLKPEMARIAQREESRRDMVDRISDIDAEDVAEISFMDTSPPRPMTILYATLDGEPIPFTKKRARGMLARKHPDGSYMFIAPNDDGSPPSQLPEYRLGSVKCFMHVESAERPVLNAKLGMAGKTCIAGSLANIYAKRIHERSSHKREREMYQGYLDDKKEEEAIARQDRQYEAMMALAGKTAPEPAPVTAELIAPCPTEGCNYQGTSAQLRGHKSVHSN